MANKAKKERERRRQTNLRLAKAQIEQEQKVRRMRDDVLDRMLDEHMMDSFQDISNLYHRLSSALGAKTMRFQESVGRVQSSSHKNDVAAGLAMRLSAWHSICHKHGLESGMVVDIISDAVSQNRLALKYKMRLYQIRAHIRASLCMWSLWRKRCDAREFKHVLDDVLMSTRTQVMRSHANKPANTAIVGLLR